MAPGVHFIITTPPASISVAWEASRGERRDRHLAGVSAAHRPPATAARGHMSLMNMRRYDYENMPRPEYGIWGGGPVWRVRMAQPRLPVITVYLVRARARRPPPAARNRLALSPASDGEWCARLHVAFAPHSVLRTSSEPSKRLRARVNSTPARQGAVVATRASARRPAMRLH
ncbi:hypothetical protein K1T71_002598 [Dendrolimus kikuchii]|uniref:Uncharacterized protein n=1 Tax=Dendrolimus kikuchii TaxID=765133 RepID=A0ACC1DE36_9NEOP|nr:hypothetical protein K1T71_002598 [Dendrolimus kikuchii]